MASKLFSSSYHIPPLLIFIFLSTSFAQIVPLPSLLRPDTVCHPTLFPDFCKSLFPDDSPKDIYDFSRFSVDQSLWSARKFLSLVDEHLTDGSILSDSTIQALEDCKYLAERNTDFVSSTFTTLNSTRSLLRNQTDDLHTWLSAIVTNQQTCLDGLKEASVAENVMDALLNILSDGAKRFSVSLSLFTRGWVLNRKREDHGRKRVFYNVPGGRGGRLRFKMSDRSRQIFDKVRNRKLVETSSNDSVIIRGIVVVNPDGSGNFTTINAAVAAAPNNTIIDDGYFLIYVVAGVYEEYVNIDKKKKNLMMLGEGINQTVITGNHSVGDGWSTFNSATLIVVGQGFVAVDITFRNTAGPAKGQAVAVRNGADLSTFYSCSFDAYQDTLYTHSLRQFYRECDIYGTVDFIFGDAAVVFQNCNIYPRLPKHGQFNTITAQGRTDPNQNTGTSIHNCTITPTPDLVAANGTVKTVLGRPWQQYSRVVVMQSFLDSFINPLGWDPWDGGSKLINLYYAEYNNTGPGANTDNRVTWPGYHSNITMSNATAFTVSMLLSGDNWLPVTGVPYVAGFV